MTAVAAVLRLGGVHARSPAGIGQSAESGLAWLATDVLAAASALVASSEGLVRLGFNWEELR